MNINYSFLITSLAGFSTLIGSLIILFNFKNIKNIIIFSLSFSSGVMITMSLLDLLFESIRFYNKSYNTYLSILLFLIFFILGSFLISLFDKIKFKDNNLYKVGIVSMIGIIFHNIPEGIITFITSSIDRKLGLSIALAISLHNIPEGISIAVPIYYSTNKKAKAIIYTFISAISEILGAALSYIFLKKYISNFLIGTLLSLVCGIMSYISIFELVPEALKYNNKKLFYVSFFIGSLFMIISLII